MLRRLIPWSVIGFCVPIGWGILSFVLFSAKESTWTTVYWWCVYITCPFWLLPTNTTSTVTNTANTVLMPFLNALMYGIIAFLVIKGRRVVRGHDSSAA
jgi:hypothetical protein